MDVVASIRRSEGTSGAAIVVAGSTVVISILGLYISDVAFVGALGLAAAITVAITMLAALTLVPAFLGVFKQNVRSLSARVRAHKAGETARDQARRTAAATAEQHENSPFARWGRKVSAHPWPWAILSVVVLLVLAIPFFSITLGQPDNGTNPTSRLQPAGLRPDDRRASASAPTARSPSWSCCRSSRARPTTRC